MNEDNLRLIVLDNCRELGEKINEHINIIRGTNKNYIVPIEAARFNNGEGKLTIKDTIRDKEVFLISDVNNYSCTYEMYGFKNHMGPDEHYMDILRTIYAIRGNCSSLSVIMPLLYESRQHRRKGRESLDCAESLQTLVGLNVNNIITFDAHDENIINAIPNSCFENFLPTDYMLNDFIEKEVRTDKIGIDNLVVIAPDAGADARALRFAEILKSEYGMFRKRRDLRKLVDGKNPIIAHDYIGPNVENKNIIIVDDMIASGGSCIEVAEELKSRGANKIYIFSTFSLFTSGIEKFKKAYKENKIEKIFTTNLTYLDPKIKDEKFIEVVDCSEYIALVINQLHNKKSLSLFFNDHSKIIEKIDTLINKVAC